MAYYFKRKLYITIISNNLWRFLYTYFHYFNYRRKNSGHRRLHVDHTKLMHAYEIEKKTPPVCITFTILYIPATNNFVYGIIYCTIILISSVSLGYYSLFYVSVHFFHYLIWFSFLLFYYLLLMQHYNNVWNKNE